MSPSAELGAERPSPLVAAERETRRGEVGSGCRLRRWLSQHRLSQEAKYRGAGCCAELNKGLCPWHGVGGREESRQWGPGGVVPPPCSFTPTQAPCHRQAPVTHAVTPQHKRAHASTPAPHCAAAPRGRGPARRHCAHAAPGPSLCCRHGGHAHPSTMQPLARVGTHVVGAVLSATLAQLLALALQPGFRRSHTTAGISQAPTTHTRCTRTHVHAHVFTCTHIKLLNCTRKHACAHTHAHSLCTAHPTCLPQPHSGAPGLPGTVLPTGSPPGSDRPWQPQVQPHMPLFPDPSVTQMGPEPPAPAPPGPSPTWPPGSLGLILHPQPPQVSLSPNPSQEAGVCRDGRWGGKVGGNRRDTKEGGARRPTSESHQLQPEQQAAALAAAAAPREGGLAAAAHVAAQPGAGQHLQCRGR